MCSKSNYLINFKLLLFLLIATQLVKIGNCHRCYVCGLDDDQNCDNFNSETKNSYLELCPNSKACSIEIQGSYIIKRSCASIKIDDCRIANQIEYCYCSKDLCNFEKVPPPIDDEDFGEEGSGVGYIDNNNVINHITTDLPKIQPNISNMIKVNFYMIFTSLLIHFYK